MIDIMKDMLGYIDHKLEVISDVSLEDDDYNELYLGLREMRGQVLKTIKTQYAIDKREAEGKFWQGMKDLRKPEQSFEDVDLDSEQK